LTCDQNNPNRDLSDPTWESVGCARLRRRSEREIRKQNREKKKD